jgi:hypothetical protein
LYHTISSLSSYLCVASVIQGHPTFDNLLLSLFLGGPVNVNEQCGVLVPPNDTPCARSLTCKTHSMGAKRSVPGRSAPYDVLLSVHRPIRNTGF